MDKKSIEQEYIKKLQESMDYYKIQMDYSGLLVNAITNICDGEIVKKIIDEHFKLMKNYDEKRKQDN